MRRPTLLLLVAMGCARPGAGRVDERASCDADRDCSVSCSTGAVSRAWAREHIFEECSGGCAQRVPRCIEHQCVAYLEGKLDVACGTGVPHVEKTAK